MYNIFDFKILGKDSYLLLRISYARILVRSRVAEVVDTSSPAIRQEPSQRRTRIVEIYETRTPLIEMYESIMERMYMNSM